MSRGVERGLLDVAVHDLRRWTTDRHRTVDDVPYGGGPGMVMKAEPLMRAVERDSRATRGAPDAVVLLSPQGRTFTQAEAERLAGSGTSCCCAVATRGWTSGSRAWSPPRRSRSATTC